MKRLLLSILLIGVVSIGAFTATRAYFTSSTEVLGNSISVGTVSLQTDPESGVIVHSNVYPGWNYIDPGHWGGYVHSGDTDIRILNDGTLPVKYRMRAVVTGGSYDDYMLDSMLTKVSINKGTGGSWETVFNGTLRDLLSWHDVDSNFGTTGHSGWYGQGEYMRIANALPFSVGNDLQGQSIEFKIEFNATQTINPGWDE